MKYKPDVIIMVFIFWKLYVLPWGQMSLWAATVITNLLSAIPWIGKDLVEFGNLENVFIYSNVVELGILPIIGTINSKALNKIKLRTEQERLDTLKTSKSFLAMLVGLIDGDGYIAITKTPKNYIRIDLIISLDLRDLDLINYIHSVLKIGRVNKYPKLNVVKLTISRTDLQTILFPLFIYHNLYFLTETREAQFDKVMFILQNNIKKYSELPDKFPVYCNLPVTAEDYSKLDFFPNWIVGFTIASNKSFKLKCSKNMLSKNLFKLVKSFNLNQTSLVGAWSLPKPQLAKGSTFRTYSTNTINNNCRACVKFGDNLTSNVGYPKFTKLINNTITLPPYYQGIVVGLILSDGWFHKGKPHWNAQLQFKQSLDHFPYFWYVFNLLSHYCTKVPTLKFSKRLNKTSVAINLHTRALPCFTKMHSLFYINGVKVIPENIYNLLTPVALAHWIQGDGVARSHGLIICTDSYKIEDVAKLINVLKIRYNIDCILRFHTPTQPRITIRTKSIGILRNLVMPYMHNSMLYKLGLNSK